MGNQVCNCFKENNLPDQRDQAHAVSALSTSVSNRSKVKNQMIDEVQMEEINANTPIKHETINRKSNRFSRSTNQDVNNS